MWALGLLDSMPELRKQQGPCGLGRFAAVCSKRITASPNPTWRRASTKEDMVVQVLHLAGVLLCMGP